MINALKHPSFFRPTSRPSSPAPAPLSRSDSGVGLDRVARTKLSLTTFRRPSPAPAASPPMASVPLVQDGSYLEMLGLKLSEAVSKAFSQPTGPPAVNEQVAGRRPIPAGRGHALGALIASCVLHASLSLSLDAYRSCLASFTQLVTICTSIEPYYGPYIALYQSC